MPLHNLIAMGGRFQGLASGITQSPIIWVERLVGIWDPGKYNMIAVYPYPNSQATGEGPA